MEVNKQKCKDPKEFAKKKLPDFTDVTILNTPLPQASSTVDRKSMQGKTRRSQDEQSNKHRQLNFDNSNVTHHTDESSLGIIQNISSLLDESTIDELNKECPENERELARELLRKCNKPLMVGLSKMDKENNVNSTNLLRTSNVPSRPSNFKNAQSLLPSEIQNQQRSIESDEKSNATSSIIFEPNEMSARSSEFDKTPEKTEPFPTQNFSGISYNSNLAEMMAQFGDEDFMSGSKAGSQLLNDEISWRKNKLSSMPINNNNNNEKERLELSCFSGIVGDVDLTMDGGRVSVGEFFKRKCGGTGHLSTTSVSDRPSFGLDTKSPQKRGKLQALVDETIATEGSYQSGGKESKSADCTKDPSVMSLSSIAQVLQEIDSTTPRKLVDQILDANKKKRKKHEEKVNPGGETYTLLPANRTSLPVSTSKSYFKEKSDKDLTPRSFRGKKLSLDSKNTTGMDSKSFNGCINDTPSLDSELRKVLEEGLEESLPATEQPSESDINTSLTNQQKQKKRLNDCLSFEKSECESLHNRLSLQQIEQQSLFDRLSIKQNKQKSPNKSIPRAEHSMMPPRLSKFPSTPNKFVNSTSINNESSLIHDTGPSNISDPTLSKIDSSKDDTLTNSLVKNQSFDIKKVEIGKKTQELVTCLVGIPKETDFELSNGTDRWILCHLKLYQIQGEKDNIEFDLPEDDILIEPDARKSIKISVRMPRMGKLTIAIFHIPCADMVTKTSWYMKHLMCFVPEEPNITISTPSEDDIMSFSTISEDASNSLPITFVNGNTIDVPVLLHISQVKPQLFSIGHCLDDTIGSGENYKEATYLMLKPKQPTTINIDFRGMSLQSLGEKALRKGIYNTEAKLSISICFKENEQYLIKEVPLKGVIGSSKLDILDTQFPLHLQPKIGRVINLKNSGSITVTATVDVVQSKENQSECRDFCVCPNNIVLNGRDQLALQISYKPENNKTDIERRAMIRIIVENKVSFYPIIGERGLETEQFSSDSFHQLQRSETPQHLRSIASPSPSSPHSLMFNRSGNSGRHSPGSTASGGTVGGTVVPIRATHTALVWGTVKAGKSDTKQLTIRNTSNNKIKLIAKIKADDQNFKFLKDRQTLTTSQILSLQGMESKTLFVVFSPHSPKAAAGRIIFSHYSSMRESRELTGLVKIVQLFGYGGCGKIEISEAVKDTSGQMWLSLGKLSSEGTLHAKIRLHNTGDLTCFTKMKLSPKALYPTVVSSWHIEPTELLLAPNKIEWVSLDFRPKKDDLANAHQSGVIHVGTLKIIHGDEPTRLRIRRLYNKLKDSGQLHDKIDEQADEFKDIIHRISKAFPGEIFTKDLKLIGDSVQNLGDLCRGIIQNEVKLTIEIHPDDTMSILQDNMDDSQVFYSLCSDHDNESHFGGESFMPAE